MTKSNPLRRLDPSDPRPPFDCGDPDLNEFFSIDSKDWGKELLAVTYSVERNGNCIAFFSLSNASITREVIARSSYERITKTIPHIKRYSSTPAVKVGRFAVSRHHKRVGVGTILLDYIKIWFTLENKTGCRFIIVDAYKKSTPFYEKNGFKFLTKKNKNDTNETDMTELMYFDLKTFRK